MADKKKSLYSHINIGTIVFLLIIVYLAGNLIRFMGKTKRAVYEVSQSAISDTIKGSGIILREEEVILSQEDGFFNSYLSDGELVKTNGIVYTIDKTGKIQEELNKIAEENKAVAFEKGKIFEDLRTFTEGYNDDDFYAVEETSNQISHDLMSYTGSLLSKNKKALEKKYGKDCYIEVKSKKAGLVSYSIDGKEDMKIEEITRDLFNDKVYMTDLRSNKKVEAGSPVYRLVTSQNWQMVVPLSKEDYDRMEDLKKKDIHTVVIHIDKDDFTVTAPFSCFKQEDQGYVKLSFTNFVQRYLNQRYLSMEFLLVQGSGLKIPASALVEKEMFRIPKEFLSKGSNSDEYENVNLMYKDKKGKEKVKQVRVKIFEEKEDMVTIYSGELKEGDRIIDLENATTYALDKSMIAYGVYSVNSGYAVFSYVDISERNEDYCIVNQERSDIQLYDRIILNSNTIKENEIIY